MALAQVLQYGGYRMLGSRLASSYYLFCTAVDGSIVAPGDFGYRLD